MTFVWTRVKQGLARGNKPLVQRRGPYWVTAGMELIDNLTLCRRKLIWSREGEHDFVDSADGAGGHKLGSTCSRSKITWVSPCGKDDDMKQEHCCVGRSDGMEQMGRRKLSCLYSSARTGQWLHAYRAAHFQRQTLWLTRRPVCAAVFQKWVRTRNS